VKKGKKLKNDMSRENRYEELYLPEDNDLMEALDAPTTGAPVAASERMQIFASLQIKAMLRNRKTAHDLDESTTRYSRRLVALTWALIVFTVVLVVMTGMLIVDGRRATSIQNNIALTAAFFTDTNTKIITAIEGKLPILAENHGQFNDAQLDNYLGNFDTIESAYSDSLLSEEDLCDSFSYYVNLSNQNMEIQNYIAAQQKKDPAFLTSLTHLASIISQSKNQNCK
jgi:hypothetical protein